MVGRGRRTRPLADWWSRICSVRGLGSIPASSLDLQRRHVFGWFTGSVTELPPVPLDPAALRIWVAGLSRDELTALAQQVSSGALTDGFGPFGELEPRNREIDLPPPADEPSLLTLTIELRGSKPRIWRRLSLPGDLTLDVVHTLFQAAMGWTDSHLHRFQPGRRSAFRPAVLHHGVRRGGGRRGHS